jgi:hypothetical protein
MRFLMALAAAASTVTMLSFAIAGDSGAVTQKPAEEATASAPKTVAGVLAALKTRPGIQFSVTEPDHWTIATASDFSAQWSFTPPGHYAHPAVVQRLLKKRPNGDMYVEMGVFCESAKAACDRLSEEFTELNRQMRDQMPRNNIEPPVQ